MYDELSVFKQIKEAFPNLSQEECEAALVLLKGRADALNVTFERYMKFMHPSGIAERDTKLPEQFHGYIKFLGNDASSIIKPGNTANFSTFVHECGHVFRRQLTGKLLDKASAVFDVDKDNWTEEKEELFAKGFEEFVRSRKEENNELKKVYTRGAKFVQTVYKGVKHIVKITPEMEAVYEDLFKANTVEIAGKEYVFDQKEYENRIHAIAQGDKRGTHVLLGPTPYIYEELGFERLPMMITREHLNRIMHDEAPDMNYHGIDEGIIKQIPQQLKNPIMIIQSGTHPEDIVSIIELHSKNDNPIIVPIKQNANIQFSKIEIDVNLAKTIYAKDSFTFLDEAFNDNRILYVDKEKSRTLLHSGSQLRRLDAWVMKKGLQLPSIHDVSGFYINNIARYRENFKQNKEQSVMVGGKRILFQGAEVDQMMFDLSPDNEEILEELTPQNFADRFIAHSREPRFKDDKIEAARILLRETTKENRQAILADLRGKGCIDPESTHQYLRSLLQAEETKDNDFQKETLTENKTFKAFGAWTDWNSRLSTTERKTFNNQAIDVLAHTFDDEQPTPQERAVLSRYSGFGGIDADDERGVLYDYYTSPPVADMTWKLLDKIEPLKNYELVLEPSCGTGVFFETAPNKDNLQFTGVELDGRTAAVANALHKDKATIINQSFEQFNLSDKAGMYDRVIGNAPFGVRSPETAKLDMPNEKSLDNYFVSRCIDNLKDNGTMALIVAPGVLENKSNADFRLSLCKKAQFAGAVKLPDKSFHHTHTQVEPDILLFRKYPIDIIRRIEGMGDETFKETDLYNEFFVSGNYFKVYPRHVTGELSEGSGQWGRDEVKGYVTPSGIEKTLADFLPFEQIEYDAIRREFDEVKQKDNDNEYLYLTAEESEQLKNNSLLPGTIKTVGDKAYLLDESYAWKKVSDDKEFSNKLKRILTISGEVKEIRERMRDGLEDERTKNLQGIVKANLNSYSKAYNNYPADDKDIKRFLTANPAVKGVYEALITPEAELLNVENIYDNNIEIINGHNPAIEALRQLQIDMLEGSEENIKTKFPDNAEALITEMRENKDVFVNPDKTFMLREDFIAGDAWEKIDALVDAAGTERDRRTKTKLLYGASELERAVGWTPIEEADFSPRSTWIPESIIKDWVNSEDGLGRSLGELAKNEAGKWGRLLEHDKVDVKWDAYNRVETVTPAGTWIKENDEIVYYLNSGKQHSTNIDTDSFNRDHDEAFQSYIANHEVHRNEMEQIYNRTFRTNLSAPVKTYPIGIKGWKGAEEGGKTVKPHQWQTVHQMYRQGCGISALGTGFGKTLSGVALMSLLRQEGSVKRAWLQVPNNKVKDWIEEIKSVMPELKIASIDPEDAGYGNREKRYAKYQEMASGGADIILMPESAASEIQLKADNDAKIRNDIAGEFANDKKSKRQKELAKIKGLNRTQNGKTNKTICFEDFGCDALFVDEAHRYKNLFTSSLSRETGMNDGRQSAKAMALFKKSQYIREMNDNKNVFLFTATPLTNSPLEYYNMLQFVGPQELKRFGISTIDNFIREFADLEKGWLYDWATSKAKEGMILKGFKNLDTLQNLFFKYTDMQHDPDAIGLEKPASFNRPNLIPSNEIQTKVLHDISDELERYKSLEAEERKREYPGQNFLTFFARMRTASLDLELYDPETFKGWENPKLETLAKNAYDIYEKTKAGQVVFCDRVFSSDGSFNIHEKIKAELVAQGFKENEIVIVNGWTKSGGPKSDSLVEKEVSRAIAGYNAGKYKVIVGSTACIGEGVNLQKNSSALHHFDIPFRPSDFVQRNGRIDRQGNEQENVALHTYMSAGTMDNYSVNLVQRKADWIDQLLKTKSNVFTNPNDESAMDADELLLALTEEWGDKEKAAERRAEMERIKAGKITEARNKQRTAFMKTLSAMRGSLLLSNIKPESKEYKNRIGKIHNVESALKNNPTFRRNDLLGNNEVFLYNAECDEVFRKGDIVWTKDYFGKDYSGIVEKFNFKKGEMVIAGLNNEFEDSVKVSKLGRETNYKQDKTALLGHIEKADGKQIEVSKHLKEKEFYTDFDDKTKEEFYDLHIKVTSESYRSVQPVLFYTGDGKLEIQTGYRAYQSDRSGQIINPFSVSGIEAIKTAVNSGLEYNKHYKEEILKAVSDTLPHLHDVIADGIEKTASEVSVDDGEIGERSAGSIRRDDNLQGEEKMADEEKLESESLNRQKNDFKALTNPAEQWIFRGGNEFRKDNIHRIYFDFKGVKDLYGLKTYGEKKLTPGEMFEYKTKYHSNFLPKFPAKAWHNDKQIDPKAAFDMLCSRPYYDIKADKMEGLVAETRDEYQRRKFLALGGKEYIDEKKYIDRVYLNGASLKRFYGLETTGKVELSAEQIASIKETHKLSDKDVEYLPAMPKSATLYGKPVESEKAFELMLSRPYYDVHRNTFVNCETDPVELYIAKQYLNNRDMGAEEKTRLEKLSKDYLKMVDGRMNSTEKQLDVKNMSHIGQLESLLKEAVKNDSVPWQKPLEAGARAPHNPVKGYPFTGTNLIATTLHMESIGSNDPRYLEEKALAGFNLKPDAIPLRVGYRITDENGEYKSLTKDFYNARDIENAPGYKRPSPDAGTEPVVAKPGNTAREQFKNDMAGFMQALKSGAAFEPKTENFAKEDYAFVSAMPVSELLGTVQAANVIGQHRENVQQREQEPLRKAVGFDS
ncbi:hypothetical protein FACS1894190_10230 [Spirochaetia bacterium]|nr:hypothetical protein FACS1894190_10230 [Spirochaetia bacterium]